MVKKVLNEIIVLYIYTNYSYILLLIFIKLVTKIKKLKK